MNSSTHSYGADQPTGGAVVLVLDEAGTVLRCTAGALDLIGRSAEELRGRRLSDLVADPAAWAGPLGATEGFEELRTALLHQDGSAVDVDATVVPLPAPGEARFMVCVVPAAGERWVEDNALIRALCSQEHIGLVVHDTDLLPKRGRLRPVFFSTSEGTQESESPSGTALAEIFEPQDAAAIEDGLRRVLETGEPLIAWEHSARRRNAVREDRLSVSAYRLQDARDRVIGVAAAFTNITEQYAARRRLSLLNAASERLGRTLDVTRNAEELTAILVPEFADLASVDLSDALFEGEDSGRLLPGTRLQRVAVAATDGSWPPEIYQRGDTLPARGAESEALRDGRTVLMTDLASWCGGRQPNEERRRLLFPNAASSALFVPLHARNNVLGVLGLWRTAERTPFTEIDVPLIEEVASRAALSLENARRYTAELRTVQTLQQSLLPPAGVKLTAAESAGIYVSAGTAAGAGGGWYDVIELSSTRVAFVIGDVAGHGLSATATMGRLRTAVQTLADLDLAPEELLTHLDDLVVRLGSTEPQSHRGGVIGTTCLYCVYDPVSGRCVMASAGHPPPVLTDPDGRTDAVPLKPGPALGVGGMPFDPLALPLDPGSVLAFPSNKLVAQIRGDDPDDGAANGPEPLREALAAAARGDFSLTKIGQAALDRVLTEPPADDVALLVARVRSLSEGATAAWQFAADPSVVGEARHLVTSQLTEWELEEMAFTTELIVSELITNAIRYAGPPIGLRLIKDKSLICEVSDPSQTQPHVRRARLTDEGGRGLFLIAQLARRWGSRYTDSGKTIWTEQTVDGLPRVPLMF